MPYITPKDRNSLINDDGGRYPETAGELNYLFTMLIDTYLTANKNYQAINDCLGALEGCKLELYRRVAAPYEDKKIKENGEVYSEETLA